MLEMKNLQTHNDEVEKMEENATLFRNTYTSILDLIQLKTHTTYTDQNISADVTPPSSSQSTAKRNLSHVEDQSSHKRQRRRNTCDPLSLRIFTSIPCLSLSLGILIIVGI